MKHPPADTAAHHWILDGSVWSLVAANAVAIAIGVYQGWSLVHLAASYWAQSLIIGAANVFRIAALDRFSTKSFSFTANGPPVSPTPATKRRVALGFGLHYGGLHVMYFLILLVAQMFSKAGYEPLFGTWFWIATAAFGLNHLWSYRYNRELDRRGMPNIGTLMWTPYLRIVPMHLTLILGISLDPNRGLLLFGILKTVADVVMHYIEHAQLRKLRDDAVRIRTRDKPHEV